MATDAILLRRAAQILERLDLDWWNKILLQGNERPKHRLFKAEAVAGVDEFMSRLFEEMDFKTSVYCNSSRPPTGAKNLRCMTLPRSPPRTHRQNACH